MFGKEEEFSLNQNNQVKMCIKQLEKTGIQAQKRNKDLRIIQTEGSKQ